MIKEQTQPLSLAEMFNGSYMKNKEQINLFDLLMEITKHCTFNPQPELMAEFANRLMVNKFVTLHVGGTDPDEILFDIMDIPDSDVGAQ